ncbi:ketopantoate reductase family protein [Derxia gummosa]|uniref:2-dehydropantoate 2-reductase n=1 Tax=Derxia gummosa DSM 723 TaxID=1121388 RepID=A0A8B6X2G0_9BURK|nr:ketopantoate reductase family protein [Derxia gummosa]
MKICVLGAGALGCALGGSLAEAGADVWLLCRPGAHADAIRRDGLVIHRGGSPTTVAVRAATRAEDIGPVDLVIVLVKSFDTRAAMASAGALIGPDTVVMSLQNGLGHEELLAEAVGRERVLAGKTYVGGVLLGPGRISAGTAGKRTIIGELDGRVGARTRAIAAEFERAGLVIEVSDNILGVMWDKLLVNVATGALTAITGLTYGEAYRIPEIERAAIAAVAEAMACARADGIRLSIAAPQDAWRMAAEGLPADFRTSMLQSLAAGSITEIDFINGAVVRAGERLGLPTPVNATLVAAIKGIERAMAVARQTRQETSR